MGISFVQQRAGNTTTNATSLGLAYNNPVASSDLLVALVLVGNGFAGPITVSVSDSVNGAWSTAGPVVNDNSNDGCQMQFFRFDGTAAGTPTVTASASTSHMWNLFILEYSGIATSGSFDNSASSTNAAGTSGTTASVTTTNANDLILAALGSTNDTGGDSFAGIATSGAYTLRSSNTTGNGGGGVAEQIVSSSGTITGAAFTWSFSNPFITQTAAFKSATVFVPPPGNRTYGPGWAI